MKVELNILHRMLAANALSTVTGKRNSETKILARSATNKLAPTKEEHEASVTKLRGGGVQIDTVIKTEIDLTREEVVTTLHRLLEFEEFTVMQEPIVEELEAILSKALANGEPETN